MMSQALKATFSGFTKEQVRLGIPKGKTVSELLFSRRLFLFNWGEGVEKKNGIKREPSQNQLKAARFSSADGSDSFKSRRHPVTAAVA